MQKNILLILLFPFTALAQLRPSTIFSDNMILQREQPIHLWGKGLPGKKVLANFGGKTNSAVVQADSSWSIYFIKQKANTKPQSIVIISGNEKIEFSNILVGDINKIHIIIILNS